MIKVLKVIGALVGVFLVGIVLLPYVLISRVRGQVRGGPERFAKELQALRKDGIPVAPEHFQRPVPPPGRNAAPDYVQLTTLLKARPLPKPLLDSISFSVKHPSFTVQQERDLRSLLAQRTDVMDLVHRAAGKPECVFRRDWSQGPAMLLSELTALRTGTKLITAESYLMALDGRYSQAVANQALGFRIAGQAAADPVFIGILVGIANDGITLAGMEQILRMAGPDSSLDSQIEQTIARDRPRLDLANGLKGEIASNLVIDRWIRDKGIAVATANEKGQASGTIDRLPFLGSRLPGAGPPFDREFADASTAETLHYERLMIEAESLPEPRRRAAFKQVMGEIHARFDNPEAHNNLSTTMAAIVLPVFDQAEDKLDNIHDRESVLMAAAAVLAFRARHYAFPRSLEQAMGHTPTDHFTGQPLGCHQDAGGFVVYSRGTGSFDPGQPPAPASTDVYFRYP